MRVCGFSQNFTFLTKIFRWEEIFRQFSDSPKFRGRGGELSRLPPPCHDSTGLQHRNIVNSAEIAVCSLLKKMHERACFEHRSSPENRIIRASRINTLFAILQCVPEKQHVTSMLWHTMYTMGVLCFYCCSYCTCLSSCLSRPSHCSDLRRIKVFVTFHEATAIDTETRRW